MTSTYQSVAITHPETVNDPVITDYDDSAYEHAYQSESESDDTRFFAEQSSLKELSAVLCDPRLSPKDLGSTGERYVCRWLEEKRWVTLSRNWQTRYGELDIVMITPEHAIVFVEVKTRRTLRYGSAQEAVSARKQMNLRHAGVQWLLEAEHRISHNGVRFDVATVMIDHGRPAIHHIPGAF